MSGVEERLKQLNEIQKVVEKYENQVNGLLQQFGWTKDKLPKYKENTNNCESQKPCEQSNTVNKQPVAAVDLEAVVNIGQRIEAKRSNAHNFTDLNKLKRDLKRRRIKYRTTKTAPLTYTEELRELINLQMELVTENKEEKEQ